MSVLALFLTRFALVEVRCWAFVIIAVISEFAIYALYNLSVIVLYMFSALKILAQLVIIELAFVDGLSQSIESKTRVSRYLSSISDSLKSATLGTRVLDLFVAPEYKS